MATIEVVQQHNMVLIRLEGMIDADELSAFLTQYRGALKSLGTGVGSHSVLVDLTSSQVNTAATVNAFMAFLADPRFAAERARHVAMVATSPLFRMQLDRIAAARPGMRVFSGEQAASSWLHEIRMNATEVLAEKAQPLTSLK